MYEIVDPLAVSHAVDNRRSGLSETFGSGDVMIVVTLRILAVAYPIVRVLREVF